MKHPASLALHAYWSALKGARTAPERSDIDPTEIRHLLADTFVLAADADGAAPSRAVAFRLSGTRLNALFRHDLKGSHFSSIVAPGDATAADLMLDATLDDRTVTVASVRAAPPGRAAVDLELLLLPLRHHGKTHARILGSLAAFVAPDWMGACSAAPLRILSFRTMTDWHQPNEADIAPARLIGRGSPFGGLPGPIAPNRRFRVIEGGRSGALHPAAYSDPYDRSP